MERPMGQKAAKRKGKASEIPNATQDAKNKRAITMDRLAQAKEDELELRVVQMMMKDTSTMNDSQQDIHEKYYNYDQEFWELVEEEFMDDSDEEEQLQNERRSGSSSRPKRRTTVDRGREEGHNRLFNDYFSENLVYTDVQFRRRFRMHRHVFLRIVDALGNHDEYFQMRVDATGKMGLSPLQKCTSAIRMLAYGSPADLVDEYVRIGESTSIECLERFVKGVDVVFGAEKCVTDVVISIITYVDETNLSINEKMINVTSLSEPMRSHILKILIQEKKVLQEIIITFSTKKVMGRDRS
ncbi:hypothetical protein KIW84_032622 [Lathyrus oleraceus]|uniref:Uncharacterized protein n=1 Tax=Pisum sativum TaxID=3888 RepID=A0A9D4XZ23_PEA|nr:hypothetical protein KIW84_032622 [Pisum sativum]